jgi:iron complex outermembrane recepter protein
MVDGRRLNEIDIAGTDWAQIPLENVEKIEILRGSGSVLYGDNATAGAINILTKRGKKGHYFRGGSDFGSYRYQNYFATIRGAEDFASYNFLVKHEKTDGYRLNGDYDGYDFTGAMTIFPAEYLEIDFSGGYHKDWYGLSAGLQRVEIDRIGYRGSTTPNDRCKTETTFLKISPGIKFNFGDMEHGLSADIWGKKKRINMINWDDAGGWVPWYPSWDTSQIDSIAGSVKYTNRYGWDENENNMVMGIDIFSADNRLLTVTPQWGTYNQLKISKKTLGIYFNDKINLQDKFILSGGFRQEWAVYGFDQNRGAGSVTEAGLLESKSPRVEAFDVGCEYKYLENGGIYGRFSRSYRLPATDEFYSRWTGLNSNLKHQKADTWEVGIKDRNCKYFQPVVNFFWMKTDDEIFYDPTVGAFGDNSNYDGIRRFGIETGVKSNVLDWMDLYCNYTYLDAKFEKGVFSGNYVPMVPEHKISWGLNIVPEKFIEINFNSEFVSEQFSINDQYNRMPKLKSYFVCGGKVSLKHNGWKIFLGINNMFDARYSEIAASDVGGTVTDVHPSPERNYLFGLSAEF